MNKQLVILGAGVGGLSSLKEITECGVPLDDIDITMVDEDFSHFLGFTLPWVMRGWRDQESVPIRPSADALSSVRAVTGSIRGINPTARTVSMSDSTEIPFDALLIATGARNAIEKIPGLRDAVESRTAVHYYSIEAAVGANEALTGFTGGKLVFLVTSQPYRCPVAPYEGAMLAADLLRDKGSREGTRSRSIPPRCTRCPRRAPMPGLN